MNSWQEFSVPVETLVFLFNVAVVSCVACASALIGASLCRNWGTPLQHAILVSGLLLSLLAPVLIAVIPTSFAAPISVRVAGESAVGSASVRELDRYPFSGTAAPSMRERAIYKHEIPLVERPWSNTNLPNAVTQASPAQSIASEHKRSAGANLQWRNWLRPLATAAAAIWSIGVIVQIATLFRGVIVVRRFAATLVCTKEEKLQQAAHWAASCLGARRQASIWVSHALATPLSLGIWRPRIVIPADMESQLDEQQLRAVILHEASHIANADHWIGILQRLATAAFWWNPLHHRTSRHIDRLREYICDDVVTRSLSAPQSYASALIELAGRISAEPRIPATIGILPSGCTELEQRICRLLNEDRPLTTRLTRSTRCSLTLFVMFTLTLLYAATVRVRSVEATPPPDVTAPQIVANLTLAESQTDESDKANSNGQLRIPQTLIGKVVDLNGKPIEGASLTVEIVDTGPDENDWQRSVVHRVQATSNTSGEYRIDTAPFSDMKAAFFLVDVQVQAVGFAEDDAGLWYRRRNDEELQLPNIELAVGRAVSGRCVDPEGQPVADAIIRAAAWFKPNDLWIPTANSSDTDGRWEMTVPVGQYVEFVIAPEKWAPVRVAYSTDKTDLGDIHLESGTSVVGQVLSRDGKPIAGCAVGLESVDSGNVESLSFAMHLAVKSDENGRFRFSPVRGDYKLFVAKRISADRLPDGGEIVSDVAPPSFVPRKIHLDGVTPEQTEIVLGLQTVKVSGIVRWSDGHPAVNCRMSAAYLPDDFGTGIDLGKVNTDAQGRYSLEVPSPIGNLSISCVGLLDESRAFHMAHPTKTAPGDSKSWQFLSFDHIDAGIERADWELRKSNPASAATPEPQLSDADRALDELGKRYNEQEAEYIAAINAAKDDAQTQRADALDPRNAMADDFVQFEQKYRGQSAGFQALRYVIQLGTSLGNPDDPVAVARGKAVEVLREHYLDHEDLDSVFTGFDAGAPIPGAERLLRAAAHGSRQHVRAAALYCLAKYLEARSKFPELARVYEQSLLKAPERNKKMIEFVRKRTEEFGPIDSIRLRSEAIGLLQTVIRDYPKTRVPPRMIDGVRIVRTEPDQVAETRELPYDRLAKGLLYSMTQLQIGQPVPNLAGVGVDGDPIELEDFRGKVALITFFYAHDSQVHAERMELLAEFKDRPLAILGICSDSDPKYVREAFENKEINWPVLWDGSRGPIATDWNVQHWPTDYLIDHRGVIRATGLPLEMMMESIRDLVAEAEKPE